VRSLSFRDLLKIPALSGYKEIELVSPKMDHIVAPWVHVLGIDTNFPVEYMANIHRDMSGKVDAGYRVVGEVRTDDAYLNSGLCDQVERIIIAGKFDMSLARELAELMNQTVSIKVLSNDESDAIEEIDFPIDQLEPEFKESEDLLTLLTSILLEQRNGNTFVDYKKRGKND